jgi:hypothetical protein
MYSLVPLFLAPNVIMAKQFSFNLHQDVLMPK